jgi:2,3-bisphosphoglycerate-independent phosphoglycerate mutase
MILVPDGAADNSSEPNERTPLEIAHMPNTSELARRGRVGLVRTIPRGVAPGSDAANLAVMGYDPATELTGRSPLEAVSMGIELGERDVAFRTNLVTLAAGEDSEEYAETGEAEAEGTALTLPGFEKNYYERLTIIDHSAGDISSEEARVLMEYIDEKLGSGDPANGGRVRFYPGVSYRHALIVRDGGETESGIGDVFAGHKGYGLVPPHDILGRQIGLYLPDREGERYILELMRKSYPLLTEHEINKSRAGRGLRPANSIWIWGEGTRPALSPIAQKYGVRGSVISAVDLIKGIGICAGLEPIFVEGATGTITTNFRGKAEAAIAEYKKGKDLAYIHVEAPDECAHQGNMEDKIRSLELIDEQIVAPVLAYLKDCGDDYRILIVPDHRTPVCIRTHTDEPVPYVLYDSREERYHESHDFTERSGASGGKMPSGRALADEFFEAKGNGRQ